MIFSVRIANSWNGHHAVSVWIFIKGVKGISFSQGISLSYTGKLIAGDICNQQSSDRFIITVSAMCYVGSYLSKSRKHQVVKC